MGERREEERRTTVSHGSEEDEGQLKDNNCSHSGLHPPLPHSRPHTFGIHKQGTAFRTKTERENSGDRERQRETGRERESKWLREKETNVGRSVMPHSMQGEYLTITISEQQRAHRKCRGNNRTLIGGEAGGRMTDRLTGICTQLRTNGEWFRFLSPPPKQRKWYDHSIVSNVTTKRITTIITVYAPGYRFIVKCSLPVVVAVAAVIVVAVVVVVVSENFYVGFFFRYFPFRCRCRHVSVRSVRVRSSRVAHNYRIIAYHLTTTHILSSSAFRLRIYIYISSSSLSLSSL